MSEAGGGRRAGQDPWVAAGEAGLGLALRTPLRGLPGPRGAAERSGRWPLLGLPCRLLCDPALHPALSALGPQRRKLLAVGEEAFARWFPARLGKPAGRPSSVHKPLGLKSGLWSWGSLGLRLLLERPGIGADLVLEELRAPSHKRRVRRNNITGVRTPL